MPRENRCQERIDAEREWMARKNRCQENRCQEIHFAWQAQYLVKLECDFSWQAQHFVTFWEIAGARNVDFFNTKSSPRSDE